MFKNNELPPWDYAVKVGEAINWDALSDDEYIQVIAGLKAGGMDDDDINCLAMKGARYEEKEDKKRIASIKPTGGITFGTAVYIAKKHGFVPYNYTKSEDTASTSTSLVYPGTDKKKSVPANNFQNSTDELSPLEQTVLALEMLFEPTDHVNMVLRSTLNFKKQKYDPLQQKPENGYQTCENTVLALKKAGSVEAIASHIPDYNPDGGAWIQLNANDGQGSSWKHLTSFKYLLVECDELPIEEQTEVLDALNLPELYRVESGARSVHCVVKVDARSMEEYEERKNFVYDYCKEHGLPIDKGCGNPGRLSRLPGAYRGDRLQRLMSLEKGPKSYEEWEQGVKEKTAKEKLLDDTLTSFASYTPYSHRVEFLPTIIDGLLRKGKLMEIVAPPKAGKTWLCHNLARAVASGGQWLGFQCEPGKVLYFCPELDTDEFVWRGRKICEGLPIEESKPIYDNAGELIGYEGDEKLVFFTEPGLHDDPRKRYPMPHTMDELVDCLETYLSLHPGFSLIIVDPIYIFMDGEENSNSDVARSLMRLKDIARNTGAAVVFCHHTTKGSLKEKNPIDCPAGAGSYGRIVDAMVTLKNADVPMLREDKNHEFFKAFHVDFVIRSYGGEEEDVYVYRDGYGIFHRVPRDMTHGAEVI